MGHTSPDHVVVQLVHIADLNAVFHTSSFRLACLTMTCGSRSTSVRPYQSVTWTYAPHVALSCNVQVLQES